MGILGDRYLLRMDNPIAILKFGIRKHRIILLALALSLSLTLGIYGAVLGFPFLFDDIIHLRWLEGRAPLSVWTNAKGMQHYRPLVMSIWALSERWLGPHNPHALHALSLVLHIANGCLVAWLARQLMSGTLAPLAATALFVSFPWSYQALPSPGSQSKPLSTLLILISCALYGRGRSRRQPPYLMGAAWCAVLAPFAYEAAITAGGFLLLSEFLLWKSGRLDRPSRYSLLLPALGLPFLTLWLVVPSSYDAVSFPGWEALWQSSIYFVQGLTWPIALLAKPLMTYTGLSDGHATALVGYAALVMIVALYLWRRRWATLVVALGWYVLALLVQWVTLSFRYVIDGPRVLYLASVGMALLWADMIGQVAVRVGRRGRIGHVIGLAFLLASVAWGARFSWRRLQLCANGLVPLIEASRQAEATPDESWLFINVPAWITVRETGFALGHEGYTLLPPYYGVGLSDFAYVNYGLRRDMRIGSLPDIRREWTALIGYHGRASSIPALADELRAVNHVSVLTYESESLHMQPVGGVFDIGEIAPDTLPAVHATFEDALDLRQVTTRMAAGQLQIELLWSAQAELDGPYTVFAHLYGTDGRLVAQADGYPLGGTFPPALWRPGEAVRDIRYFPDPEGAAADYVLGVGLYRADSGERARAVDAQGLSLPDNVSRWLLDLAAGPNPSESSPR
ncbi:MAG: hypothetical protein JXA74_14655 [Anaerolineae bacterium]|nr:hypothetical protein [Anaerolineae bacterium]